MASPLSTMGWAKQHNGESVRFDVRSRYQSTVERSRSMYEYPQYKNLKLDRPAGGVLRITLSRGKVNAMDGQMHADIARIWPHVDADDETRAVVLTGEGRAFSAGGDFDNESVVMDDYGHRLKVWREAG